MPNCLHLTTSLIFHLKQTVQTTTTGQRTHNTGANPRPTRSTSPVILILSLRRIALWRVALLRIHRLLLVLHGRLVVALLLAAGRRAVGTGAAHGRCWRAVISGLLVGAGVVGLGWVGGRRAFGAFVGHFMCGLVGGLVWLGRLVGGTEASVVTLWGSGSVRGGFAPDR